MSGIFFFRSVGKHPRQAPKAVTCLTVRRALMSGLFIHRGFLILVLVNLASFVSQIVQIGVMEALIPLALTRAGFPAQMAGSVLSLYWIAVLLGGFGAPALIGRLLPFWVLVISGLSSCLMIGVLLGMPGGVWIMPITVFAGFGLILRWVICDGLVVQLAPQGRIGVAVGVHETLMGMGIAAGPLAISWIGAQGGQILPLAVFAAILPVVCALAFPKLRTGFATEAQASLSPSVHSRWQRNLRWAARRWGDHLDLVMIAFVSGFIEVCFLSLLPLQAEQTLGVAKAGLWLATVFALGGTICQPPLGHLADRLGAHRFALLCLVLIVVAVLPMEWAGFGAMAAAVQFVIGAGVAGLYTAAVVRAAAGKAADYDPVVLVVVAQSYTLGAIVGPVVATGLMASLGLWTLPVVAGGLAGLAMIFWLGLPLNKEDRANGKSPPKQRRAANKWRL
jgi:MFS family permease